VSEWKRRITRTLAKCFFACKMDLNDSEVGNTTCSSLSAGYLIYTYICPLNRVGNGPMQPYLQCVTSRTILIWIQVKVFWVVTSCSGAVGYQRFGAPCCLHYQGEAVRSYMACHNPEDLELNLCRRDNFKSCIFIWNRISAGRTDSGIP